MFFVGLGLRLVLGIRSCSRSIFVFLRSLEFGRRDFIWIVCVLFYIRGLERSNDFVEATINSWSGSRVGGVLVGILRIGVAVRKCLLEVWLFVVYFRMFLNCL